MRKWYTYRVWSRDYGDFVGSNLFPVYRKKVEGKRWFYAFWGYYPYNTDTLIKSDKLMLERSGFKRVELFEVDH